MSNMSYCRFQNTLRDMCDCVYDMQERANNDGLDEHGEALSDYEKSALRSMYNLASEMVKNFNEDNIEMLTEAESVENQDIEEDEELEKWTACKEYGK